MHPFAAPRYRLVCCDLHILEDPQEAHGLSELLASMDPWRTLHYAYSTPKLPPIPGESCH